MTRTVRVLTALAIGAFALAVPSAASASNITFQTTIFNTDYVTSAVGLRGVSGGSIPVAGVSGSVTRAFLYWHGPGNSADPNFDSAVTFNGTGVVGTQIGFSDNNFWGYANSQAWRADVTALVTGNGSYTLADFANSAANGVTNSASLWVFYNDGNAANNRDVVLYNGNDANFANAFDNLGWDFTLANINYTSGAANLTTYVSDGQNFSSADDGTLRANGTPVATGGLFQGLAPNAPGAGVGNGSLGDINTFSVTSFLSPGLNNLHFTMDPGFSDALSLIVAAIDLPAGAAPPINTVPEPTTLVLLGSALLLAGRRFARR